MSKFYDIRPLLKQMKKVDAKYVAHLEQEVELWMDWLKSPVEVDNG